MSRPRAPWWMFVIAASFLAYFALLTYSVLWEVQRLGVNTEYSGGRMLLRGVDPGSPAWLAGLRAGDHVLAVNGQAVHNQLDWMAIAANLEAGRPNQLEIERAGRRLEMTMALRRLSWSDRDATTLLTYLAIRGGQLVLLVLAFVIAFSRPYDSVARVGGLFLAAAGVAWPQIPYGMAVTWRNLPLPIGGLIWIAGAGVLALGPIIFTFFSIFPRVLFRPRWAWALSWLPGLGVASYFLFYLCRIVYQPEHAAGAPNWASDVGDAGPFIYPLAGIAASWVNYRRLEDANERRRIRVLFGGCFVGLASLAVLFPTMLRLLSSSSGTLTGSSTSLPVIVPACVLFQAFPLSFAYAILRHRLFDIRVMIRQGLQYAVARGALLSVLPALAVVFLLDLFLHGDQPAVAILRARGWGYLVLAVLALAAQARQKEWLAALDRRFFRERYDAQRLLREVVEEIGKVGSFDRVAPRVVAQIEAAFHAEFAALLAREPHAAAYGTLAASPAGQAPAPLPAESKLMALVRVLGKPVEVTLSESGWLKQQLPHEETDFLRQARIDLLVPIATSPDRAEVLLVLGAKRSEEPYAREDLDLLVAIAASLRLLLEKPQAAPAPVSEAFEECPQCGTCYDTGAGRCLQEGAGLLPTRLPRSLAGRYRLERRRGRGGMGAVYEAVDAALERRVAVKVIRDELVGSVEAAERFRREARVAASFTHPNVVTVYDFGVAAETRAFMVMELLEGLSLRQELEGRKRLPVDRALGILQGVCAAVEAAHHRQLIHRDLKPENIFLARGDAGETPKVLDFGIAKFLPTLAGQTMDTGTGLLLGTVRYMSPEQLRGQAVNTTWDLWALAVVAYEMLAGALPFAGTTVAECHSAVLTGRLTPLTTVLPEAPPRWQEFFARSFSSNPSDRPKSAQEFFTELERALKAGAGSHGQ